MIEEDNIKYLDNHQLNILNNCVQKSNTTSNHLRTLQKINNYVTEGYLIMLKDLVFIIKIIFQNNKNIKRLISSLFNTIQNSGYPITMLLYPKQLNMLELNSEDTSQLINAISDFLKMDLKTLEDQKLLYSNYTNGNWDTTLLEFFDLQSDRESKSSHNPTLHMLNKAQATVVHLSVKTHHKMRSHVMKQCNNPSDDDPSFSVASLLNDPSGNMPDNKTVLKTEIDKHAINTITNIKIFNVLLEKWAKMGVIDRTQILYHLIKFTGVTPNADTFSHMLLCVGLHFAKSSRSHLFVAKILEEMNSWKINTDDLFTSVNYLNNEHEYIYKAIRLSKPNYEPPIFKIPTDYDKQLFNNLTTQKSSNKDHILSRHHLTDLPYSGILDKVSFMKQLKEQLRDEINGFVMVKSIFKPILPGNRVVMEAADLTTPTFINAPSNHLPDNNNYITSGKNSTYKRPDLRYDLKKKERFNQLKIEKVRWRNTLEDAFRTSLKSMRQEWDEKGKVRGYNLLNFYPFLKILPEKIYVDAMMNEIEFLAINSQFYSPTSFYLYKLLGTRINQKYIIYQKLRHKIDHKLVQIYEKFYDYLENPDVFARQNPRTFWNRVCLDKYKWIHHLEQEYQFWPSTYHFGIGKFLYSLILQNIKIEINDGTNQTKTSPAFFTIYRQFSLNQKEEFKPHPLIVKLFRDATPTNQTYYLTDRHLNNNNQFPPHHPTPSTTLNKSNAGVNLTGFCEGFETDICTAETPPPTDGSYLKFETVMLPMLVPPVPWTSIYTGGYLLHNSQIIRVSESWGMHFLVLAKTPAKNLLPTIDSITYLGMCPWTINQKILDIIIHIFNSNGNPGLGLPSYTALDTKYLGNDSSLEADHFSNSDFNVPISTIPYGVKYHTSPKRYSSYADLVASVSKGPINPKNGSEMYSLWCDTLYKLSIANHFRHRTFWFPYNLDFRSRTYPIPPYFNHLSGDTFRSLFLFAKGQTLGPNGLRWLKLHIANLIGTQKKKSIEERLKYVHANLPTILKCAQDPLKPENDWWMKGDDPWQTLACCFEIDKAMKHSNPEEYVCHYPIHQDGSCNGLQHYAALGRDEDGGSQVNLVPNERPQDVYTAVAENVEKMRLVDETTGIEIAKELKGRINRKVVKQTVMTVVYGVTHFGAKEQISRQIEGLEGFPSSSVGLAASYLVLKTFDSIKKLFAASREIQAWFTECARLICQNTDLTMEWITPLGFPVVQPYSKRTPLIIPKAYQNENTSFVNLNSGIFEEEGGMYIFNSNFRKPITRKQKNAFPPNFIHSLDSSHMMLTALHSQNAGINFVAVHDCFWTHPAHVEIMNKICRDQFVLLHSQPVMEELSKFFVKHYSFSQSQLSKIKNTREHGDMIKFNKLLMKVPEKGTLEIQNVKDSTFFFS